MRSVRGTFVESTEQMDHDSLRKKMQALEQMRTVETRITEGSLPLIRCILHELENDLHTPVTDSDLRPLQKGELWWQDLDLTFSVNDPRCFPVVREFFASIPVQIPEGHFANGPTCEGRPWKDLVTPVREQVLLRTKLRHIAGTP